MNVTERQERRIAKEWHGIDPEAVAFARRMGREERLHGTQLGSARAWLHTLREAGLPTDLNLDFDDPAVAEHLEDVIKAASYAAAEKRKLRHVDELRDGLKLYELAFEHELRSRPVPPIAQRQHRRFKVSHELIRARLPEEDQKALDAIEKIVRKLGQLQWEGRSGKPFEENAGHFRHATIAPSTAEGEIRSLSAFFQHGHRKEWEPFTLKGLLTPERLCDFWFYGERFDGTWRTAATNAKYQFDLLDFFYRGRTHHPDPVVVIDEELQKAIFAQVALEETRSHLHHVRDESESNSGRYKWLPTLEQVERAITALEQQIARAEDRYARRGMTRRQHWLAVRDATIAIFTLYCMTRSDTVSTISLSHLKRDRMTGGILTFGGSAIVAGIARAKTKDRSCFPFVPELIIPANVLPYLRRLLEIEGRSLETPLKAGERPVKLSAANGDSWGDTTIPSGEVVVVPLWRSDPDSPEPLSYSAIRKVLENELMDLRFGSTNPHTFRATGAIYWTFLRGMPEEYVMRLGLWDSPKQLRESYARITSADEMRLMAAYIPVAGAEVPELVRGEREQAAGDGIGILTRMLITKDANEAELLAKGLRRQVERLERSIAAQRGTVWEPLRPNPFREGELARIDDALRCREYEKGISSVIGRAFWAEEELLRLTRAEADEGKTQPKVKHLKTTLATRKPVEPRKLGRVA